MKLIQFHLPNLGKRVGIVTRDEEVIDVTSEESPGVLEVLELADREQVSIGVILADIQEKVATPAPMQLRSLPEAENETTEPEGLTLKKLDVPPDENVPHLLSPIDSPEVWGCGVTYKRSADMRDDDSEQDIYSRVYFADRPGDILQSDTCPMRRSQRFYWHSERLLFDSDRTRTRLCSRQ